MEARLQRPQARLPELEIVRAVSFAAVVLQHVLGAYVRRPGLRYGEGVALALLFGLLKFAVPTFVFVSGVVLFRNYYGRLQYGAFLKKRLLGIVAPYLIWAVLYYLYGWMTTGAPLCGKRAYLLRVFTGQVSYHTWYVLLILQFYLLLPVIFALWRGLSRWTKSRRGCIAVVTVMTIAYLLLVSFPQIWQPIPILGRLMYELRAQNCLYYLPYFLLGGVVALHLEQARRQLCRLTPLLIAAAALGYGYCQWYLFQYGFSAGVPDFNWMGSLNIRMFVFTTASIALLYRLSLTVRGRWAQLCAFVGKHAYAAYLFHVMVLTAASQLLSRLAPGLNYPAFYALLTALTLACSLLAAWGFDAAYDALLRFLRRFPSHKTGS